MENEVKFRISIEDNGSHTLKTVGINADDLRESIAKVRKEVEELDPAVVNFAQLSQGIDSVTAVFDQLSGAVAELTSYSQAQVEVETKLQTAMRNTMAATDEEIQSIKELCSAQQELGVIGDEVQLAGAQELATYLAEADSLRTLIPVMNDMVAQQYGLNASQESAAQIASMLGKVMAGQTSALSRYGYTFDEAQEEVLKFGTESERAAMLAQVVSESVGGMNAELAKTDAGRAKQLDNALGDLKETAGNLVQRLSPALAIFSNMANSVGSVLKLANAFVTLKNSQGGSLVTGKALAAHQQVQAVAQRLLAASGYTAAAGTTALRVAVVGLYAALTLGVSFIIQGLVTLFSSLGEEAEEAADGVDDLKEATDAMRSASSSARGEMLVEANALKQLMEAKNDTSKAVKNLNERYGEALGYHKSAAEWYDVLKNKSQAYCAQLGYEAQAKVLATKKAAKEIELEEAKAARQRLVDSGKATYKTRTGTGGRISTQYTKEYQAADALVTQLWADVEDLGNRFDECNQKAADAGRELNDALLTTGGSTDAVTKAVAGTLADVGARLTALEERRMHATDAELARINREIAGLEAERKMLKTLDEMVVHPKTIDVTAGLKVDTNDVKIADVKLPPLKGKLEVEIDPNLSPMEAYRKAVAQVTQQNEVAIESMKGIGSAMSSLGQAVGGAAGEWLKWGSNLMQAIAAAIPQIMALSSARRAEATANTASAATGAASSVASIPYVGPVMAVAAVASVLASLAALPKFANGAIAYGPTLGLFGEYAGASSNPEVVAPLSKLKDLLAVPSGDAGRVSGTIELRARGRALRAVMARESLVSRRSN